MLCQYSRYTVRMTLVPPSHLAWLHSWTNNGMKADKDSSNEELKMGIWLSFHMLLWNRSCQTNKPDFVSLITLQAWLLCSPYILWLLYGIWLSPGNILIKNENYSIAIKHRLNLLKMGNLMDLKHSHQREIIIKCSAGILLVSAYCY